MAERTRVAWEARDGAMRLRGTVSLTNESTEGSTANPLHQPRHIVSISTDVGRPATEVTRYNPSAFTDVGTPVTHKKSGHRIAPPHDVGDDKSVSSTVDDDLKDTESRRSLASEMVEPIPPTEQDVIEYRRLCRAVRAVPARYFERYFREQTFSMNNHGLGTHGAQALAESMHYNDFIKTLELAGNAIGAIGMRHVVNMLSNNDMIDTIDLSNNSLCSEGLGQAAEHFGSVSCILKDVNLSSNKFLDMDARVLCEALKENTELRRLNLANNAFGDAAARAFGSMLSANTVLQHLDLSGNCIRHMGAQQLATGLSTNGTLLSLDLSRNGLGNKGAIAMAGALSTNTSLTALHLASNNVGDDGIKALAQALTSRPLNLLDVSHNPVTSLGMQALFEAVGTNGAPCTVTFKGIVLDAAAAAARQSAEDKNPNAVFVGDEGTALEGFDKERRLAMEAAASMAIRAEQASHTQKYRPTTTRVNANADVGSDNFDEDGAEDSGGLSGLPAHLSRSTKGNLWDNVDEMDLRRRGVNRSSMTIDPNELAGFDENDPQAERMRIWATHHPDTPDPMLVLERYMFTNRLKLIDFFFAIDKDRSGGVTWDELAQAVDVLDGLDLSHEQMQELMERLDVNTDGEIAYEELCKGRQEITEKLRARDPRWTAAQQAEMDAQDMEGASDEDGEAATAT
eukprot:m.94993 g.94993  ORF g.94993 m.94993 type:complete len:683 (-) comp10083_c0_seq3:225-2273(-)